MSFEYNLDYYSGAQASMFIENILIDEVTSLQWTIQQSKVPIYGYASQLFDDVAKGTLIVQGSFSINFVESGYLFQVLNSLRNPNATSSKDSLLKAVSPNELEAVNLQDQNKKAIESYLTSKQGGLQKTTSAEKATLATPQVRKMINDYVWGPDGDTGMNKGIMDNVEDKDNWVGRRTDHSRFNGFDIYLRFDQHSSEHSTITKIEGVHLLGKSQTVVIDENPVQEVYSFYARNVI